jgi:hypothetical protein
VSPRGSCTGVRVAFGFIMALSVLMQGLAGRSPPSSRWAWPSILRTT